MNAYKHYLCIYGGQTRENSNKLGGQRLVCADVFLYDLLNMEWKELKALNPNVTKQARRFHCAAVVGDNLITFGGVNSVNDHVTALQTFNLNSRYWSDLEVQGEVKIRPLSCATMIFVVHS